MFVVGGSQVTNHFIALVSYIPVHNNKLTQGAIWGHPGVSMDYVNVSLCSCIGSHRKRKGNKNSPNYGTWNMGMA